MTRRRSYGDPSDLFERVALRWSQVIGAKVTATQVGLCLIDLKLARLVGDPSISTAWSTWPATPPACGRSADDAEELTGSARPQHHGM